MLTFFTQTFATISLIFATLINSIIPMLISNPATDGIHYDDWSPESTFTIDYDRVLQKDPDEDFKVLVITDVQLKSGDMFTSKRFDVEKTIATLVEHSDPDLIIAVGDNAIGMFSYEWFITYMDSFDIPWAVVMGNHDGQDLPGESWAAYKTANADNSLFKFGPKDMGHGNYVIQIAQENKIIHSIYMMDTHDSTDFWNGDQLVEDVYDGLWNNQINWYKWNVNGLNALTNSQVESSLFIHIPLPEYVDAYNAMANDPTAFGSQGEGICHSGMNTGMFDVIKELGSTKNVICGHDHLNTTSTVYEGVRLSYATKTGTGSYHDTSIQGGSLLTIDENGVAEFSHIPLV